MLVLINGLSHFGSSLAKDLNDFDHSNRYIFLNTYVSKLAQFKFLFLLPFAGLVISFNGVSSNSGTMNWVLRFGKKVMMFWHGTDALLAKERFLSGTIYDQYIQKAHHFSDAPWLLNELSGILPNAEQIDFKNIELKEIKDPFLTSQVLTYIPDNKEDFYGMSWVIEAAKKFPLVTFYIMGNSGKNSEKLKNLVFLGWINSDEAAKLYENSPIFLRLTKHDGNALSVAQALSVGAEVIWTYPHEKTHLAENQIDFDKKMEELISKYNVSLARNHQNIQYVKEHYNKEVVMKNLINKIHEVASK